MGRLGGGGTEMQRKGDSANTVLWCDVASEWPAGKILVGKVGQAGLKDTRGFVLFVVADGSALSIGKCGSGGGAEEAEPALGRKAFSSHSSRHSFN